MSTTSTFRYELGFNRSAAPFNTALLTEQSNLQSDDVPIYPLQNALSRLGPGQSPSQPAWCTFFRVGDKLSFRLVDITDLQNPDSSAATPSWIGISFKNSSTGVPARPFTVEVGGWTILDQTPVMRFSSAYSRSSSQTLPTWDIGAIVAGDPQTDPLVFAPVDGGFQRYELSVGTLIARNEQKERARYVFDPEIIVSDGGQ